MIQPQRYLRLRAIFTTIGVVAGEVGAWRFTGGDLSIGGILFFLAVLAIPFGVYLGGVRTLAGSVACGAALITAVVLVQVMVTSAWEAGSSTAPLAYLWFPFVGGAIVGVVIWMEWASGD